ncbi:MAG: DUF4087 domain-containing protein [Roseiarcus sp.]
MRKAMWAVLAVGLTAPMVLGAAHAAADASARRCGWLENPTPGNWWLTDQKAEWILATQGAPQPTPDPMDMIPDISVHDYVKTNGEYGYACACLEGRFDQATKHVLEVTAFKQLPLQVCKTDKNLPKP